MNKMGEFRRHKDAQLGAMFILELFKKNLPKL
jgi:hypothetical protein